MCDPPKTQEQWQAYLEGIFTDLGALLTYPDYPGSPQALAVGPRVMEMHDGHPEVYFWDTAVASTRYFTVDTFTDEGSGRYMVKTVEDVRVILSTTLNDHQRAVIKHWIG